MAIVVLGTSFTSEIAKFINNFAWQGKTFNAERIALVNKIIVLALDASVAHIPREPNWIDGEQCIFLDSSIVARGVRDKIRLVSPGFLLSRESVLKEGRRYLFYAEVLSRHAMRWLVLLAAGGGRADSQRSMPALMTYPFGD